MITMSNRQVKEADRVGGIELMIVWPEALGIAPVLGHDVQMEATPLVKTWAERELEQACRQHGLVAVHTRVACVHRPVWPLQIKAPAGGYAVHVAVTVIGQRWVHATGQHRPPVRFAPITL